MISTPQRTDVTVRLDNVSLRRKNIAGAEVDILHGISLSARGGEITAIIGPSGGGKSSLIRLINRLAEPSSGTVSVDGVDIRNVNPLQLRRTVALVAQKPFMFEGTVLANLQRSFVYSQQPPPGADSDEVSAALALARLEPLLLDRDARSLSLGQQQRVSLARALITKPRVLLLDEPTSALDRRTADALAGCLQDISRSGGITIVLVTHDLRLAERIADYCFYLEGGRIVEEGRGAELLARPASEELRRFLDEPSSKEVE